MAETIDSPNTSLSFTPLSSLLRPSLPRALPILPPAIYRGIIIKIPSTSYLKSGHPAQPEALRMTGHRRSAAETGAENTPPARRPLAPLAITSAVSPPNPAGPPMRRPDTSAVSEAAARLAEMHLDEPGAPSRERSQLVGLFLICFAIFASTLIRIPRPGHTRIHTQPGAPTPGHNRIHIPGAPTRALSMSSTTGIPLHVDPCPRCEMCPASRARRRPAMPILPAPGLSFPILCKPAMRARPRPTLRLARESLTFSVQRSLNRP